VLVYTSAIMMVLRFFAGPLVKVLSPLGLLAACAVLAMIGLNLLAFASGLLFVFFAATLYGVGKTYFWPTMLGVVSEQCPKGGALTINAIAGIGMLTVGIIGGPLIGRMQEASAQKAIEREMPGVYQQVSAESAYFLGTYTAVDPEAIGGLPAEQQEQVSEIDKRAKQGALAKISIFPGVMLACYIGLILYFRARGGYKAVSLSAASH
jgi:hypothetical protein